MSTTDAMIIRRCREGALNEFSELYTRYVRKIYDFIYYKTMHRETAEDITGTVFMKALERVETFDENRGTVSAWLYAIARNAVTDHYRKNRARTVSMDDIWDLPSGDDVERDVVDRDRFDEARALLAKLPEEKRNIVIMRIWQGLPYREIARITGRTEPQCKMIFYRALDQLRKELPVTVTIMLVLRALLGVR